MNDTKFDIPVDFVKDCLEHFDTKDQLDILQEECAELIQACSKVKRNPGFQSIPKLVEEMAHVLISSAVVATMFNIEEEEILDEVNEKAEKYGFPTYHIEIPDQIKIEKDKKGG